MNSSAHLSSADTWLESHKGDIEAVIQQAFDEDIKEGDHSTLACVPMTARRSARILAKASGTVAGIALAKRAFHQMDPELSCKEQVGDGEGVEKGQLIMEITGPARSILTAERTVLNFMQRMSGIATATNRAVEKLNGYATRILDTRKTTPGLRVIEKWAVHIGGGTNHRYGLYDAIMLKENHIDYAGGIVPAITSTLAYLKNLEKDLDIIVEVRSLEDIQQALTVGQVRRLLLDNFDISQTKAAVELIDQAAETESSGNITLDNVVEYAQCGVDYISMGALTHSAGILDLSLVSSDL